MEMLPLIVSRKRKLIDDDNLHIHHITKRKRYTLSTPHQTSTSTPGNSFIPLIDQRTSTRTPHQKMNQTSQTVASNMHPNVASDLSAIVNNATNQTTALAAIAAQITKTPSNDIESHSKFMMECLIARFKTQQTPINSQTSIQTDTHDANGQATINKMVIDQLSAIKDKNISAHYEEFNADRVAKWKENQLLKRQRDTIKKYLHAQKNGRLMFKVWEEELKRSNGAKEGANLKSTKNRHLLHLATWDKTNSTKVQAGIAAGKQINVKVKELRQKLGANANDGFEEFVGLIQDVLRYANCQTDYMLFYRDYLMSDIILSGSELALVSESVCNVILDGQSDSFISTSQDNDVMRLDLRQINEKLLAVQSLTKNTAKNTNSSGGGGGGNDNNHIITDYGRANMRNGKQICPKGNRCNYFKCNKWHPERPAARKQRLMMTRQVRQSYRGGYGSPFPGHYQRDPVPRFMGGVPQWQVQGGYGQQMHPNNQQQMPPNNQQKPQYPKNVHFR
eukprot:116564_1